MLAALMTPGALALWRMAGYLACFGAVAGGLYGWGHHIGAAVVQAKWDAQTVVQQKNYEAQLLDYTQQLEALRQQVHERQVTYESRIRAVGVQRDAALASLRDRAERSALPASGGAAQACAGATGASLSRPDAEFLVGLAARADDLRAALERCQGGDVAQDGGRLDR
jgi:hypothetical protein